MIDNRETEKAIKELKTIKKLAWVSIILIIITVLVLIISLRKSSALSVNQIIKYKSASYKVVKINHKKTYALICPYYNYRHFYSSKDWGWLYGQNCQWININKFKKAKVMAKKPKFNSEKAESYNYLNSLTANQFKKYYKDMTDIAVMRPTKKNIAKYVFMTNFMRQKSLQFAYAYYTYILNHPKYDIAAKMGTSSWSWRETFNYSLTAQKRYIYRFQNKIGLFFFFSEKNPYSLKQVPIMNWLLHDNNIVTIGVSNDSCPSNLDTKCVVNPEAFKYYNVKMLPETIMVYRKKDGEPAYQIVGSGLTPESTLISRIFFYLHSRNKVYYKNKNFENIKGSPYMGASE